MSGFQNGVFDALEPVFETIDFEGVDSVVEVVRDLTDGRGVDSAIDAVGMEAHATVVGRTLQATKLMPDRIGALLQAARSLRRGGTLSLSGVYVGFLPLFPIGELFDRQFTIRMGQANVKRWVDEFVEALNRRIERARIEEEREH